jgi:hypothetical protein
LLSQIKSKSALYKIDLNNLTSEENKLLNYCAIKIRKDFDNLILEISKEYKGNLNWILSSLPSRNMYLSPLFIRCCYIALIDSLLKKKRPIYEIILTDKPFSIFLKKHFKECGYKIKIKNKESFNKYLWYKIKPFRQFLYALILLFLRYLGRKPLNLEIYKTNSKKILLDTFVLNSTPGDGGTIYKNKYNDRYYTGIFDYVDKKEKEGIFYYPTIIGFKNPLRAFRMIRSSSEKFIIPDDFLKLSDYFKILSHPLKILKIKFTKIKFLKYDISYLLNEENINNSCNHSSIFGLLNYYFALRFKNYGIKFDLLIDWYENQLLDRGMILGFNKFHKNTEVIGYQGYVISPALHLYIYPNRSEIQDQVVPHKIAVIGEKLKSNIKEFYDGLNVIVGPAFRNQKVWEKKYFQEKNKIFKILIGLPIGLKDSRVIINKLIKIERRLKEKIPELQTIIKPHPTHSVSRIKEFFNDNDLNNFIFYSGDFHRKLNESNLLITNASTVALEALAKAVPVIIIGEPNGVLQSPIPESINNIIWEICYSNEELLVAILRFKMSHNKNQEIYSQVAEEVKINFFSKVNRRSVRDFLGLE